MDDFKWIKKDNLSNFNEGFINNYDDENSVKRHIFEVDVEYSKELFNLHKDFPFLPKREKNNNCKKLICSIEDKEKYVFHIRTLKQALNHGLKLKKVHKVIQFNQKAWLKSQIDMNTSFRKEAKNDFEKDFYKLMNNFVFGKTMENVRNYKDIKIVTTNKERNRLVSEPNYHTTKYISKSLLIMEIKKTKVKMTKPIYLGLSI